MFESREQPNWQTPRFRSNSAFTSPCQTAGIAMEINIVLILYVIGAGVVGYCVYKEIQEPSYKLKNDKRIGPSYWGIYHGCTSEQETLRTIVPPPPSDGRTSEGIKAQH